MAKKQNLKKSAIVLFALFLGWAIAPAVGQTQKPVAPGKETPIINPGPKVPAFAINPTSVKGGEAFSLTALSYSNNCATTYSHLSVDVDETRNVITLSYLPEEHKEMICPAVYKPYGPTFKMKPLKPGRYSVQVKVLAPCLVSNPACEIAIMPQYAGVLVVTDGTAWQLKPGSIEENKAFKLQILNEKYGSCGVEFPNTEVSVDGNTILLSYSMTKDPNIRCIQSIIPWGPTFELKPLKAGAYKVMAVEKPACLFGNPRCLIMEPAPEEIGSLIVNGPTIGNGTTILPELVDEGKAFTLTVTSYRFTCNATFANKLVKVTDNKILLNYDLLIARMPCPTVIKAYSTGFSVPGLKEGKYEVFMISNQPCDTKISACLDPAISIGTVTAGDGRKTGILSPEVIKASVSGIQVMPDRLAITITDSGLSTVRVELFSASGALVKTAGLDVSGTRTAMFYLPAGMGRGMVMLRLSSGGRAFHSEKVLIGK